MSIGTRAVRSDEFRRFLDVLHQAFGGETTDDDVERARRVLPLERAFAAFEDDAIVGTTGVFPFVLTVPGGEVSAGGVTMVGVPPSHRRRGVLSRLMEHQLADGRARGEAVAILWASESSIYHRFGYGLATKAAELNIERERTGFLTEGPRRGRMRLLSTDEALKVIPNVYELVRAVTPGMYVRTQDWWEAHTLADPKEARRGGGPLYVAVWELEGRAEGYALYRVHSEWADGFPVGWLEVDEAVGTSPAAVEEIWRFLFGVDLVNRINGWKEPADHPLLLMLAEPRRLRLRVQDGLWLRIIDLDAALRARAYAADGTLVFELADRLCPWNEGRWSLEVSAGRGTLEPTSSDPELALGTQDLAAAYLGGVSFGELERAGRIEERAPGAVSRATAMFASARPPWCPEIF
jgi:predicted acetyltransferase